MIVGIVADTHVPDLAPALPGRALLSLREAGVDLILHAGDICRPDVLRQLRDVAPVAAVRGNRDVLWPPNWRLPRRRVLRLEGVSVGLIHGHRRPGLFTAGYPPAAWLQKVSDLADAGCFDGLPRDLAVIVFGHTHIATVERIAGTLFVNPGALAPTPGLNAPPSLALMYIEDAAVRAEIVPQI